MNKLTSKTQTTQRATVNMIIPWSRELFPFEIEPTVNPHDCAGLLDMSASNYICFGQSRITGELNVS